MGPKTASTGPRRLVYFTEAENGPAGTTAREALLIVTPRFLGGQVRSARLLEQYPDRAGLDATLFGVEETREIHVICDNPLADQLRDTLQTGQIPGWRIHELPAERTPVHVLYARLSSQASNPLRQIPFVSAEEIAALPDDVLLQLRQLGTGTLAKIRSALADPALREFTAAVTSSIADAAGEEAGTGGEDVAARLRPELWHRYRDFLRGLATADIPPALRDRVLDSLAAEPVPLNDPDVGEILTISGAFDLLAYYDKTHETPKRPHHGY
jgi:hypothetical protein